MNKVLCVRPYIVIILLKAGPFISYNTSKLKSSDSLQRVHFSKHIIQPDKNQEPDTDISNNLKGMRHHLKLWKYFKFLVTILGITVTSIGTILVAMLGSPEQDSEGNYIKDDLSDLSLLKQYIIRAGREFEYYLTLFKQTSRDKLLPDPLEPPYLQPKYTLVLEFTDVLVHQDWTIETGWRFKKRPLLEHFLETLTGSYEIVIYTGEQGKTVFPLLDVIDPHKVIAYKLVRDATYYSGGNYVKNLKNLNRDLRKVICIDWNDRNVKFNQENLLHIKRWLGNDDDTSFLDLATFLKTIAVNDIDDVRLVLAYYRQYEDPIAAFKEKQQKLIEDLESQSAAKRNEPATNVSQWTPRFFRRSF